MTIKTFRDTLARVVPPWLSGWYGSRLLYSMGVHLDLLGDMATDAVKMRFPGLVDPAAVGEFGKFGEDVLPYLGRDRRIIRGPGETALAYAARLKLWKQLHQRRGGGMALLSQCWTYYQGTVPMDLVYVSGRRYSVDSGGVFSWGTQAGWTPTETTKWARWWLFYHWPVATPAKDTWDSGSKWDDGRVWDSGFTAAQVADFRVIPEAWNSAHSQGTLVILAPGETITGVPWGTWKNQIGIR